MANSIIESIYSKFILCVIKYCQNKIRAIFSREKIFYAAAKKFILIIPTKSES